MWISKVEDAISSEQKDSVTLSNPIERQNYMRSTGGRAMRTVELTDLTRESAAFVTFSRMSVRQSAGYGSTLSGVDVNLFAAD